MHASPAVGTRTYTDTVDLQMNPTSQPKNNYPSIKPQIRHAFFSPPRTI